MLEIINTVNFDWNEVINIEGKIKIINPINILGNEIFFSMEKIIITQTKADNINPIRKLFFFHNYNFI